jgi:hypothetical protein
MRMEVLLAMQLAMQAVMLVVFLALPSLQVTVHEVRVLSDSGRTNDYVSAGEGVTLSCLFLRDASEVLDQILWTRALESGGEAVPIVSWTNRSTEDLVVLDALIQRHLSLKDSSPSSLVLKEVDPSLHGPYSCLVTSSSASPSSSPLASPAKKSSSNEAFLTVVQAADKCEWETHSSPSLCTQDITLYCRDFFPKPSPVCGVYDDDAGAYLESVSFDRIDRKNDASFEVSLFRRLHARDFVERRGHSLSFRCFVVVMSTTWRSGVHVKLFGEVGCLEDPPTIHGGYFQVEGSDSCWSRPREGSTLKYFCNDSQALIVGPEALVCSNGSWRAAPRSILAITTIATSSVSMTTASAPTCSRAQTSPHLILSPFFLVVMVTAVTVITSA